MHSFATINNTKNPSPINSLYSTQSEVIDVLQTYPKKPLGDENLTTENKRANPYISEKSPCGNVIKKTKIDPINYLLKTGKDNSNKPASETEEIIFLQRNGGFLETPGQRRMIVSGTLNMQHISESLNHTYPAVKIPSGDLDIICQSLEEDCELLCQKIQNLLERKRDYEEKITNSRSTSSKVPKRESQKKPVPFDSGMMDFILKEYDQAIESSKKNSTNSSRVPLISAEQRVNRMSSTTNPVGGINLRKD